MTKLKLHDRQKGEGAKAWAAFCLYRDMGADRSLAKVGRTVGKTTVQMERYSRNHKWVARVHAFQAEQDSIAEEARKRAIQTMYSNQENLVAKMYTTLQLGLGSIDEYQVGGLASMAKAVVAIDRQRLGLVDKVEITGKDGGPMEHTVDIAKVALERVAAICGSVIAEDDAKLPGDKS